MRNSLCIGIYTAGFLLALSHAAAQERVELKITTFVPPTHFFLTDFLQPWAAEITKRTSGRVTARFYAGNSPLGNTGNQADQVAAGVSDIAMGSNGFPRGRLPRSSIMELPLMAPTSVAATKALWSMRESHLSEDFKGFKVLGLMCGTSLGFFTRDKKVEKLEDLKGLRIRVISPQAQAALQLIGAVPVALPAPQIYENLERGIVDGVIMGYDGLVGFRVENLVKYHFPARMFVGCFHVFMNPKRFESLSGDAKKAIEETSGDPWTDAFPNAYDKSDRASHAVAAKKGVIDIPVSPEAREKWRDQFKPVVDRELAALESKGVANARGIYEEMLKRVSQHTR